ncbi:hypothetical protein [Streptomyces sp. NPDC001135]
MQEDFVTALTSLRELANRPTYQVISRESGVGHSTLGDWFQGKSVPMSAESLSNVVVALRRRIVDKGLDKDWPPEKTAVFRRLTPQYLDGLRKAAHAPGEGSLSRLRRLTAQAMRDLAVVMEPGARFRQGIRLEELHVVRGVEDIVLAAVPERCAQLVAGEPGSGKTTVLWSLQRTLSQRPGTEALFIKATHLLDGLRTDAADVPTALTVDEIIDAVRFCEATRVTPVLLVDTLDLLMHSGEGQELVVKLLEATRRAGISVVVSCRPGEAMQLPFETLEGDETAAEAAEASTPEPSATPPQRRDAYLRPQLMLGWYSPSERSDAIARHSRVFCPDRLYGAGAAERLEEDITDAVYRDLPLREVCDNPLYLRLLFDIYAPDPPIKDIDVASLFDELRRRRVHHDTRAGEGDHSAGRYADRSVLDTARALARYMLAANTLEVDVRRDGHHLEELLPDKSWDDITIDLDELRRRGLVAAIPETSSVRFFHQTFFEYMVADYLRTAQRGRELIERMLKHPDDLVLAAVAGQLVPRESPGTSDELLELLLRDKRLAPVGIEFYAQLRSPGKVTGTAREELRTLPPEAVKRFLKVLPGHRHHAADRWVSDLEAVWEITGEAGYRGSRTVRLQLLEAVRRLLHQHPPSAIEFLDEEDRLGWLIGMPAQELSTHKERFLGLLRAAFPYDTDQSLAWMGAVCRRMVAARKYDVAADVVRAAAEEARRVQDPRDRAKAQRAALECFEGLLEDRAPGSKKSLYLEPVEQAVGALWAACQASLPQEELLEVIRLVLSAPLNQALERAHLHGAGLVARRLEEPAAQEVVGLLVDLPSPAAQTAASDHVLVPALRRGGATSAFDRHLRRVCRDALGLLPSPAHEGRRRAVPAWFADAVAQASPAPAVLLELLPAGVPMELWLNAEGLAALLVPAAVAGHSGALHALEQWAGNSEVRSMPATAAAQGAIRTAFTDVVGDHPEMLGYLITEAALTKRTSFLTTAVDTAGQHGNPPSPVDQRRLRELIHGLCSTDDKGSKREGYRLWRALTDHAGWLPPAPADLVGILEQTMPGQPLHTAVLHMAESAAQADAWTYADAIPLLDHLTALMPDSGPGDPGSEEQHLVRHVVAVMWGRLAPVDKKEERDLAFRTLFELVLPEDGSMDTYISVNVRELGWLLKRIAAVAPAEAASGLGELSSRLRTYTPHPTSLTNDLAARLRALLVTLMDKLGTTGRKRLVVTLTSGEPALARKTVEVFAQLHEISLTTPPPWFRALADREELPSVVRQTVTARLRLHARMRCGGPWPELHQDPQLSVTAGS